MTRLDVSHDQMMTAAVLLDTGVQCTFADGASGVIPSPDVLENAEGVEITGLELPNAYELIVRLSDGRQVEIPWDFARHYCDRSYRPTVEAIAAAGRRTLGERIRRKRKSAGLTQSELARRAKVGRVTLARLENGGQTPRFATLKAIAQGLDEPVNALLIDS